MIYNRDTGKRMKIGGEGENDLTPFLDKIVAEYPKFKEGEVITIAVKSEKKTKARMFKGANEVEGVDMGLRETLPPPMYAAATGSYLNEHGQKIDVVYSLVPPVMQNGVPVFDAGHVMLRNNLPITYQQVDLSIFLYCFCTGIDGGLAGDGTATYEFVKPEKVAEKKLAEMNNVRQLEDEITQARTMMSHENVTAILRLLGKPVSGSEATDRIALFEHASVPSNRTQYEKAKLSVLTEMPKFDLSNTLELIKEAQKKKVLFEEDNVWKLKKSEVLSEVITTIVGTKAEEKRFNLSEYLTENPAWVEEIKKYV